MAKSRFSKEDWLLLGLDLLKSDGPAGLTVEKVCAKADKTRGSFYHHFEDHSAFLSGLADYWRDRYNLELFDHLNKAEPGMRQLETINDLASLLDLRLEVEIRKLAEKETDIAQIVSDMDRRRLDYLEQAYQLIAHSLPVNARELAELDYTSFLGAILLWPNIPEAKQKHFAGILPRLIGLSLGKEM
ncbi:TetR/AcrR family transcriptional regulator [uncultured Cohaesibacter sp.]|uniref:TetR/AcrR family transcriptional regulator n=1 Tax=uncultured Cohaesibacter sp. TaxID=1002546 RepID=UPI00292ECD5E|nr:TetR/AcrR family transcriptional regulator [uncultured Cohaesibacter sp.]